MKLARCLSFAQLCRCGTGRSSPSSCTSGRGLSKGRPSRQEIARSERHCMQSSTLCRITPAAVGQLPHKAMTLLLASLCTGEQIRPPCLPARPRRSSTVGSGATCARDSAGMCQKQPQCQLPKQSSYLSWRREATGRQASVSAAMSARLMAARQSAGSAGDMATSHQTCCRALSCATSPAALRHRRSAQLRIALCHLSQQTA